MILVIYMLLCAFFSAVAIWHIFSMERIQEKIVCAFILIPFALRMLLIK